MADCFAGRGQAIGNLDEPSKDEPPPSVAQEYTGHDKLKRPRIHPGYKMTIEH